MAVTSSTKRIVVTTPRNSSAKQERELVAFARYCVQRIEKELGERQQWLVQIELGARGYSALVVVEHAGLSIETRGQGGDAALAIWDAMCRVEQELRERRGSVFLGRVRAAND